MSSSALPIKFSQKKQRLYHLGFKVVCKLNDNDHLSQLQGQQGHLATELGEIVLVSSPNVLDDAVNLEAFERTSNLPAFLWDKSWRRFLLVKPLIVNSPRSKDLNKRAISSEKRLKPL